MINGFKILHPAVCIMFLPSVSPCQQHDVRQMFRCGYYIKNSKKLKHDYIRTDSVSGCRENDTIASIRTGNAASFIRNAECP